MITGRRVQVRRFTLPSYKRFKSNAKYVLDMGEPYIIDQSSPYHEIPLIMALGPNKFWKRQLGDLLIVGESLDPVDDEELLEALESRRKGDIYGRWYSKFCQEGELGFTFFRFVEEIKEYQFNELLEVLSGKKNNS